MSFESFATPCPCVPRLAFGDAEAGPAATIGIVAAVRAVVPPAVHAGIRRAQPPHLACRRSTGHIAEVLDRLQTDLGEGPAVAVLRERRAIALDVGTDPRWPVFAAKARELGVGAVLCLPLTVAHCELGALTLYAPAGVEFSVEDRTVATIFAARAAWALLAEHHHPAGDAACFPTVDPVTGVLSAAPTMSSCDAFAVFPSTFRRGDRESIATADELVARFALAPSPDAGHGEFAASGMAVRVHCVTHPTVVELAGEIDIATAPYLHALLGLPPGDVIVDLTLVTFLACAGLTQLLQLRAHLHAGGAALRLAGASPGIRRLIGLTELQNLLPC